MSDRPFKLRRPKKLCSFRLSETTRKQLELMSEYDNVAETDLVILAIEDMYIKKYHGEMPDKFPNLRATDYLIL